MSLINDALKKAARQRAQEQADLAPPMPGGGSGRGSRQGAPVRAQTIVLIAGAAVALAVVSAVITGMMLTGKAEPRPAAADRPAPAAPRPQAPTPIVVQVPAIPAVSVPRTALTPTPAPVAAAQPFPTPPPATLLAAVPAPSPTAAPPPNRSGQAQAFVENLHISGVRSAGAESKALVDGHVYRVNDVLERTLGIKLVKVDSDHLTFIDAGGETYIRSF
jgi:hypothetical protein